MTDITDQQRREMAESLREYDRKHGVETTWFGFNAADLIDRPACHAVQAAPGALYECSRCGYDGWADAESVTSYCPECGAEVVDG